MDEMNLKKLPCDVVFKDNTQYLLYYRKARVFHTGCWSVAAGMLRGDTLSLINDSCLREDYDIYHLPDNNRPMS